MIALYTVKPGMYLISQSRAPVGLLPNFGYIICNRHNQTAASPHNYAGSAQRSPRIACLADISQQPHPPICRRLDHKLHTTIRNKKPGTEAGLFVLGGRVSILSPDCKAAVYSIILATTPAPTVRPPSRIAKRSPSSIAIGAINVATICTLSPGITISTPSGNSHAPVTSVVRK